MKIYRGIEFGRLLFMLDSDASSAWREIGDVYVPPGASNMANWWLDSKFKNVRKEFIGYICRSGHEAFFDVSVEFNALRGGRFNPARSFGMLYTAESPTWAALEVLYHQFSSAEPIYKGMHKKSGMIHSSFNVKVPECLSALIVVFEFELTPEPEINEPCKDTKSLTEVCEKIGFGRYTRDGFSRNFIFGNDYEIAQILGCYINSKKAHALRVPSARVSFYLQDKLNMNNIVIPEKTLDQLNIKLTGSFREYLCKVEMNPDPYHRVVMTAFGERTQKATFLLEPTPTLRHPSRQVLTYQPALQHIRKREPADERLVHLQRFLADPSGNK